MPKDHPTPNYQQRDFKELLEPDRRGDISSLRRDWRKLVEEDLPNAARDRHWPVLEDHCFARILLDCTVGQPWRTAIKPPAWRNASRHVLKDAIDLGKACLSGEADLTAMNRTSLSMRGKL
ncbi:MAG: GCN5-related N-acetyltransferase [Pseudomonadota bacterium]